MAQATAPILDSTEADIPSHPPEVRFRGMVSTGRRNTHVTLTKRSPNPLFKISGCQRCQSSGFSTARRSRKDVRDLIACEGLIASGRRRS